MATPVPQAHHIIPKEVLKDYGPQIQELFGLREAATFQQMGSNFIYLYPNEQDAEKMGKLLAENRQLFGDIAFGASQHLGSHSGYSNAVRERLDAIFDPNNIEELRLSAADQKKMVLDLQANLKEILIDGHAIHGDGQSVKAAIDAALDAKGTLTPENYKTNIAGQSRAADILKDYDAADGKYIG